MKTRKQHLVSRLADEFNFTFIEPYKRGEKIHLNKNVDKITLFTIPTFKLGSKLLESIFKITPIRNLIFLCQKLYIKIFINKEFDAQIISNPSFIQLINNRYPVVWDYNDNPFQFADPPSWLLKSFQSFIISKTQQVWASSKQINDNLRHNKVENIKYIPNGVEINFFKNINKNINERFVIGYVGIISSWFFDFDLIKIISKNFPNVFINLIGPKDPLAVKEIQELTKFDNIKIEDKVNYKDLPEIMSSFSIGIIPLKQMEEVYQLSSAKFLQYLAIGLPVVSVPFMEFSEFQKNVYFCKSNTEFLNSIKLLIDSKSDFNNKNINLEKFNWDRISIDAGNFLKDLLKLN